MAIDKEHKRIERKQDVIHLAILMAIALVIGAYLISTTALIAKDGISYINYAKGLSIAPVDVIQDCTDYAPSTYTPGYPFLILLAHKLVDLFGGGVTLLSWVYSAQTVTLFCRILALIPLYFIGKEYVGNKLSFWAMLILVMLPYPAKYGSDTLRDWPYILFLATGFLFLLRAARYKKWLMFALVGVMAGFGYMIRPMCAQLIFYGAFWLTINMFRCKYECGTNRKKLAGGLALLIIGFCVVAAPYIMIKGELIPERLRGIIESFSVKLNYDNNIEYLTAGLVSGDIAKGAWEVISYISQNLMHYFLPFFFIGAYYYFRDKIKTNQGFFFIMFFMLNVTVIILRYCTDPSLVISKRYTLPLTFFTVFFIPIGLQVVSKWIQKKLTQAGNDDPIFAKESRRWFVILLLIGLVVCIPKLVKPIRDDKRGYRLAAEWLKENTEEHDVIIAPDKRVGFYAERHCWIYMKIYTGNYVVVIPNETLPWIPVEEIGWSKRKWGLIGQEIEYVVQRLKNGQEMPAGLKEVWSYLNKKKNEKFVICRRI